jgi:hypothetical protein
MKRDNVSRSVITDRYHLIRYFSAGRAVQYPADVHPKTFASHLQRCRTSWPARPFAQLYDIKNDPYELEDIGSKPENAERVAELSARLIGWMEQVKDPLLQGEVATPYYMRAMADLTERG